MCVSESGFSTPAVDVRTVDYPTIIAGRCQFLSGAVSLQLLSVSVSYCRKLSGVAGRCNWLPVTVSCCHLLSVVAGCCQLMPIAGNCCR